jgi:hypothetical protein
MKLMNRNISRVTFTRLYAKVCQEDGAFVISVRLQNHLKPTEAAWGEEQAAAIEIASSMINALAAEFSIRPKCISIDIRMEDFRAGTRH